MLVLLVVILRLLIRRDLSFQIEAPPYANMPALAPSSNAGRRQGWQFHANNDLPPPYHAEEGSTHIRKLLTGMDGRKFGNWKIAGLRLNQYDQYGRISRSEVIAAPRMVRRLNKAAEQAPTLDPEQMRQRLSRAARPLTRQFAGRINKRSSMLPVALDLRFEGVHGEVRIFFELFQLDHGRWQPVDTWEPEMMVRGGVIHENFTYTLRGLQQGETFKVFSQRLADDLTRLLTAMLAQEAPQEPVSEDTATTHG
jgi:hypothetical protein